MDKEEINKYELSFDIFAVAMMGRGGFIGFTIDIEDLLTSLIAWCFSPIDKTLDGEIDTLLDKKAIYLKSLIISDIPFKRKIDILKDVVNMQNKYFYEENKVVIDKLLKDLKHINDFRNKLAHSPLDYSEDYINKIKSLKQRNSLIESFQILHYKNGKVTKEEISRDSIEKELDILSQARHNLLQIFALLRHKPYEAFEHKTMGEMNSEDNISILERMGFRYRT